MSTRVLLLVDDEPAITELIAVALKRAFDHIYLATSREAADQILREHPVSHVLTDCYLGPDDADAATRIAAWRSAYPTIRCAAVLTGRTSPELHRSPAIDAIFMKPHADQAIAWLSRNAHQA